MNRKIFLIILIIFSFIVPSFTHAETTEKPLRIAFVRDGYVWIKINNKETKITKVRSVYLNAPQWSYDGSYLMYEKEIPTGPTASYPTRSEIWIYNLKTKKEQKIFNDGNNPKWSPTKNIIAFQDSGVLNVSDFKNFYNVALGVDDYNWFPNGQGFIASSAASLNPDGWTNPVLYKITLPNDLKKIPGLTNHVKQFFVVPKTLTKGNTSIPSINARSFQFSPDQKWISFIVNPTASWSMDSDMLCIISSDGKVFEVQDEIILNLDDPKWAQTKNILGYIAGGGRLVFGYKNKKMKITEMPAFTSTNLTPPKYAELAFTWCDDSSIVVSRVKESEWSNDEKKRPKPSLNRINLHDHKQLKITSPPTGKGDYNPIYSKSTNKITWLRKGELDVIGNLWISNLDGKNAKVLIKNVSSYSIFNR
ncbi:TolB family protein [Gottfriedia luciferensis]|uniref:TolB family protein n=1 Tax=Gottfriedia luciferensis TaxID=178774 RepID=UPI000B440416|nr:TolB domain-containing protein [Gottfriedia luciferensis]